MNKLNKLLIVLAIMFAFANFNSLTAQREDQLGRLCEQFRDYNDCKEYLDDYPNGKTAGFAKSIVSDYEAKHSNQLNINNGKQSVEDQYWEDVKNSTDTEDFKSYLKEYPNGKYASEARRKINSGSSSTSLFTFKVTTAMTNEAYMERLENHLSSQLPIKLGEYEIYQAKAPSSLEDYFYTSVRAPSLTPQVEIRSQASSLKSKLLSDYCKSEAYQRKITVVLGFTFSNNDTYGEHLSPRDCSAKTAVINGKIVFITSQAYDGNLGGVAGANATCQMHAKNAGLSGTYKAWIADSKTNPWTSFNQLTSNLKAKFDIDEYGKTQLNAGVWTGLSERKVLETCNNWTSNNSAQSGAHGCSSTTNSRWGRTPCGVNRCDLKYRLYCVQQ